MARDDKDFVDFVFSSMPVDVKKYTHDFSSYSQSLAESVERQFDIVAASIRQTLQSTPWIPDSIKPPPPPVHHPAPLLPLSYLERAQNWVSTHRAVTAAILAFVGTGTFIVWRRRRAYRQKRRARRAANGARTEVVILAGSPHSPLTKSIALDLERRGFIVYIPVSSLAEEQAIHAELRADIHPLNIDVTSPASTSKTLAKFSAHLASPPRHGASKPHILHLASLILIPAYPSTHSTGPITSLNPSVWADTLNTHLLYPFTLIHTFLPLLLNPIQRPSPHPNFRAIPPYQPPTLLHLVYSLPSSLHPSNHAPESLSATAIQSYLTTLRTEIPREVLTITTLKLGAFDFSPALPNRSQLALLRSARYTNGQETVKHLSPSASPPFWASTKSYFSARGLGDRMIGDGALLSDSRRSKASPLRELHNGVFDAIVGVRGGTMFVGDGSWAYDFVGRWVPRRLVVGILGREGNEAVAKWEVEQNTSEEWEQVDEGVPPGQEASEDGSTRVYE